MATFKAFRIHSENNQHQAGIEQLDLDALPTEGVLVHTQYSSINYKDALAGTGRGKILRRSPLIGGIDSCGEVARSDDPRFKEGDQVLVTGCGLSEIYNGGYAEWLHAPPESVIPLPPQLTSLDAMTIGTAGFTAALALHRMEQNGQTPDLGPLLITGASGGVGNLAVDLFSHQGYSVSAATGKADQHDYLKSLGAAEVIARSALSLGQQALEKGVWGGAVDTVGGDTLAGITRTLRPWGSVASIGMAAGIELNTTVMPFIIRGASILGISSANCPYELRKTIWQRLATDLKPQHLDRIINRIISLNELSEAFEAMIDGKTTGRTVVKTTSA